MKQSKHLFSLTVFLLLFAFAQQSYADISSAALLYLRIAPGARAAGMGEAFVAVADDASSTHWNPAGLGASPLSTNWQNKNIPAHLQPITEMAIVQARGGSGHNQFDVWTISAQGLARFDNHSWFTYETFSTRTDQTVADIVKNYFNIVDDNELATAVVKVAEENSNRTFEEVDGFLNQILENVGEDYSDREAVVSGVDSLRILYPACRINWTRYTELEDIFKEGFKDSTLTEKEIDRVNFALEKSKSRFIPEEIKIKYSDLFSGELTTIKSLGSTLLIGTKNGLYTFKGRTWRTYTTEDGLQSNNILSLGTAGASGYVGTDKGLSIITGNTITNVELPGELQEVAITGVGAANNKNVWIVANDELYNYNGVQWSNTHAYNAIIDDTFDSIAHKISIFNTPSDVQAITERIKSLNVYAPEEETVVTGDLTESMDTADSTESMEVAATEENDSTTVISDTETEIAEVAETHTPTEFTIEPGKPVQVPYGMGIKGKINKIYSIGVNNLWIATDIGLYTFKDGVWKASGYKTIDISADQDIDSLVNLYPHPVLSSSEYAELLKDINDLDESGTLVEGTQIKVYANPLALQINDITSKGAGLFIATKRGIYELHGTTLSKVDLGGLGDANILNVKMQGNEMWFGSDKKIAIKASGRSDIVMMFAKWLPQLADDMYYGFLSGATNISGWGTVGGNITYINYGTVNRTSAGNTDEGVFYPFDISFTASYGGTLRNNLKGGISAKFIYSHLSRLGAGEEQGTGTATGLGFDFGILWNASKRFDVGMAVTNLGPDISYIDAGQSDPLPRNFALGVKANMLSSEYYHAIITAEVNKSLVGVNDGFSEEIKQLVINGGFEFAYSGIFAARAGYIWDDEGDVKTPTLGFGVSPLENFKFDFAYIPSNTNAPLANTLRISMEILP